MKISASNNSKRADARNTRPKTREEKRKELFRKIASSKEEATKFLQEVGILDEAGNLSELYK